MSDSRMLEVTETVAATPGKVFALLADPSRHHEIDGSGMVHGLVSGPSTVTGIGDSFVLDMTQDALGRYRMRSEIVDFEPNRRIVWTPAPEPSNAVRDKLGDLDLSGYTWGWELEPTATGGTRITHTYDWSGVRDPRARRLFPRVTEAQMAESITLVGAAAR